jgi:hypothetical protein
MAHIRFLHVNMLSEHSSDSDSNDSVGSAVVCIFMFTGLTFYCIFGAPEYPLVLADNAMVPTEFLQQASNTQVCLVGLYNLFLLLQKSKANQRV